MSAATVDTERTSGIGGLLAAASIVVAANILAPSREHLFPWWLPLASSAVFFVSQLFPPTKFIRPGINAHNAALALGGLQLVVFPTLLQYGHIYRGQLRSLPSADAMAIAVGWQTIFFVGIMAGVALAGRASPVQVGTIGASPTSRVRFLIALGFIGLVLRYPSVDQLLAYFRGEFVVQSAGRAGTPLLVVVSTFLLPCLSFGLTVSALNSLLRHQGRFTPYSLAAAAMAVLAASVFNYNRASVIVPMVIFAAVYATHIRPVSKSRALLMIVVVIAAAAVFTDLRSEATRTKLEAIDADVTTFQGYGLGLNELQLYGASPQFVAIAQRAEAPRGESIVVNAIMSPVPELGTEARDANGTILYNSIIYGVGGAVDQTLPTAIELEWDLGLAGVLGGALILGLGIGVMHKRFTRATTTGEAFAAAFFGCWLAASIILQLETISQIVIYWSIPTFLLLRRTRRKFAPMPDGSTRQFVSPMAPITPVRESSGRST